MPLVHAVVLGVIQGITEVLPISSSAHLVLIPWFLKWDYQGVAFDVALHLGTALAMIIYFAKDWLGIISSAFTKKKEKRNNLLWFILLATLPAAAAGLLLEDMADSYLRTPLLIAAMLMLFAVVLWLADYFSHKNTEVKEITLKNALIIGFAQAAAIIPGVSRSGITITAGLFRGLSREAAARFSFLLSMPIVIAAAALKLRHLQCCDINTAFWAGVIASAVSGFLAVHFLLKFVQKASYGIFVYYRIVIAIIIVWAYLAA